MDFSIRVGFALFFALSFQVNAYAGDCGSGTGGLNDALDNQEVQLVRVTSDAIPGVANLKLVVDSDANLVGLREFLDNAKPVEFLLIDFIKGIVLYKSRGFDVIKLVGKDLNAHSGGNVNMVYLSDGMVGSYRTFPMELNPNSGQWQLFVNDRAGRHAISSMFLKGRKGLFGDWIGIESVTVN